MQHRSTMLRRLPSTRSGVNQSSFLANSFPISSTLGIMSYHPRQEQHALLSHLLEQAGIDADIKSLEVSDLNDGGMGSFAIGKNYADRGPGRQVSECYFQDEDGTVVSATLNTDSKGELYELDVWRVDFRPLQSWPNANKIRDGA